MLRRVVSSLLNRVLRGATLASQRSSERGAAFVQGDVSWPEVNALMSGPFRTTRGAGKP